MQPDKKIGKKLFFTQRILGSLADQGRISLDKNVLTLLNKERSSFTLEPAYRITATADTQQDPHGLVGTIRSEKDLLAMNAEIYLDSILYEDTAYQVEPGFIGEEQELTTKVTDTELLAKFLLESLE